MPDEKKADTKTAAAKGGKTAEKAPEQPTAEKPAAEVAVANPQDGTPIPATEAQADATTANTQEAGTAGAEAVQGSAVGEAYTGEQTDPQLAGQEGEDEDGYTATKGFRHKFKDSGRTVVAVHGDSVSDLSAAEVKELKAAGLIE